MGETEGAPGPCPGCGCQIIACRLLSSGGAALTRVGEKPRFHSRASPSLASEFSSISSRAFLAPNDLRFFRRSCCVMPLHMLPLLAEILSCSFPTQPTPTRPRLTHHQKLLVLPWGHMVGPNHSTHIQMTFVFSCVWPPHHLPPRQTQSLTKAGSCLIHPYVPRAGHVAGHRRDAR